MLSPFLFFSPSLVSFNHLFSVRLIGQGSYCWKWWVARLSVFATCSLHQPSLHLHVGKGTTTMPFSLVGSVHFLTWRCYALFTFPRVGSSVHPHAEPNKEGVAILVWGFVLLFITDCWPEDRFFLFLMQKVGVLTPPLLDCGMCHGFSL